MAKSTPNLARTVDETDKDDPAAADDNTGNENNFVDFTMKRSEVPRMTTERRQAVRKNVMAPNRAQ